MPEVPKSSMSHNNGMMRRMSVRLALKDMKQDVNAMQDRPDLLLNGSAVVTVGRLSPVRMAAFRTR